jgi:predicted secreted protein
VYVAPAVAAVRALWDQSGASAGPAIATQLSAFAEALSAAHAAREPAADVLVDNWLGAPRWRAQTRGARRAALSREDARLIVARDHGFASWSGVEGECDPVFELAVDAVVLGRVEELDRLLADAPDLVEGRSAYGHHGTLLHYTAANGVEIRRQVVPANAAEITARLLDAGADPAATFRAYGRRPDTLAMLKSSAHPRVAGVAADIERVLATH